MRFRILAVLGVLLCFATAAMSQTFGTITGRVEDTSAARIPGVSISLTSPAIREIIGRCWRNPRVSLRQHLMLAEVRWEARLDTAPTASPVRYRFFWMASI